VAEFLLESETLLKNTHLSLNSALYEELFMKRDDKNTEHIFRKAIIFNEMDSRHSRNIYFQL
jgi:hypothetical protein